MTPHDPEQPAPLKAGDDLVTVVSCTTEFEAATRVATLEEAGIEAFTFGSAHAALPLSAQFLGVPVQVRASDLDRARAALSENRTQAASVDWDSVDLGEREDDLPLHKPGRMPLIVFVGYLVGIAAALTLAALAAWWIFSVLLVG